MTTRRPHGTLRRSQVLTTYGPGAMVDLPTHSVLISGLEEWRDRDWKVIHEPRLTYRLLRTLKWRSVELRMPPAASDAPNEGPNGITAWVFPEWFLGAPVEQEQSTVRTRPLVHRREVDRGKYQKKPVVPIRFVQACPRGHISDIDWYAFVHRGKTDCRRGLWVDEVGTTGDLHNVVIRCDCGESRPMSTAERRRTPGAEVIPHQPDEDDAPLGYCQGERPWLGPRGRQRCGGAEKPEINRLLIRSASNTWFADTVSVISIPDRGADIDRRVQEVWGQLKDIRDESVLQIFRDNMPSLNTTLGGLTNAEVWESIQRLRAGEDHDEEEGLKRAELRTLLAADANPDLDATESSFSAQLVPHPRNIRGLDRVVLVHRLREVMALVGFTRFEPPIPDEEGEISLGVHRADVAISADWLPAVENRGEGFFLGFDAEVIRQWEMDLFQGGETSRWRELEKGQQRWRERNNKSAAQHRLPGPAYIMLHTLSHLLINSVALDSGYSSSAIRERIYAATGVGYGILLYTASSDSEGTLGGLVEVGRNIGPHLERALERARLCSHDPVCATHEPANGAEERYLHGAACHGCVLISETSCEQRNVLLDRALVVETVVGGGGAFFR
jgi:hypothetical protein